jgi:uncharacterized protein (TIGR02266 family)
MADRRSNVRAVVKLQVERGEQYLLRVPLFVSANLSKGGMFLITRTPLKEGTDLNLRFSLPKEKKRIDVGAVVVWVREQADELNLPPGMGIRFVRINKDDQEHIANFVEQIVRKS